MSKDLDGKKCASDWPNNGMDSVPNRINPRNLIGEKLEQEENSRNDNDGWLAKNAQRLVLRRQNNPMEVNSEAGREDGQVKVEARQTSKSERDTQEIKPFHA